MRTEEKAVRELDEAEVRAVSGGRINAMDPGVQACLRAFEKAGGTLSDPGLIMHPGPNCVPAPGSIGHPG